MTNQEILSALQEVVSEYDHVISNTGVRHEDEVQKILQEAKTAIKELNLRFQ